MKEDDRDYGPVLSVLLIIALLLIMAGA